jgi:hypothetical protein
VLGTLAPTLSWGQVPAEPSYRYLDQYTRALYGRGESVYNALSEDQRATVEAITHALQARRIGDLILTIESVWGVADDTDEANDGRHQFRISVLLEDDAANSLLRNLEFTTGSWWNRLWGVHVKRANGDLVTDSQDVDCVRERGRRPALQICWLTNDTTIGEVDIDYREGVRHVDPANSDVRAEHRGTSHYELHVRTYGGVVNDWWNRGRR